MNKKITLMTGTEQDFFKRGREIAKAADAGRPIPEDSIISVEDTADVMTLTTPTRCAVQSSGSNFLDQERATMSNENAHIGSGLDLLLREDGILDAVNESAHARVQSWLNSDSNKAKAS